jgi:hypothetical protein
MEGWGKRTGQMAVVLLVGFLLGMMLRVNPPRVIPIHDDFMSLVVGLVLVIVISQFALPAYFGFRYLGRLPVKEEGGSVGRYRSESLSQAATAQISRRGKEPEREYRDSLFPFGVAGTFALLMAIPMLCVMAVFEFARPELILYAVLPAFLFVFCAPVACNYFPSPFQSRRTPLASYTGGGSIYLFHGSWPFFRLLVYQDDAEVRVMFHRFYIPYEAMAEFPNTVGFFSRGLLIKSDLPGVPSSIRFAGFGMKRMVRTVREARTKHLAERPA